jgi:hypothetical protein
MPEIDEDIMMRDLMVRATADLFAPPAAAAEAIRRQRQHRMRARVLGVAGTAAAAGLAAGTLASTAGGHPASSHATAGGAAGPAITAQLTAAQQTLFGLSAAAAKTPQPSGRYVVLTEKAITTDGSSSETGGKTSVIDTVTGGGVTYQGIAVSGEPGTPAPPAVLQAAPGTSPTSRQLNALPTSTTGLRAALLSQAEAQQRQANKLLQEKLAIEQRQGHGKKQTAVATPQPTDDDLVFEQATDLLWQPNLSPQLRAAVYKVLAATPGVVVQTGAADSSGRPAVEISRVDTVGKTDVETFENRATGATLESAWHQASGEFDADLYQSISFTNSLPANPYHR